MLAKFMFTMIVSCATLRIGPYLFYIEKVITQFKKKEKNIGHCTRFREKGDLPLWQGPAVKKKLPPFFTARAMISPASTKHRLYFILKGRFLEKCFCRSLY